MALTLTTPSDAEKRQVWDAHRARKPTRVPMILQTNPRVFLLDREWNSEGYTFEQAANDPAAHVRVNLMHQLYVHRVLNRYCDNPVELPDRWLIALTHYNVYDAAALGAPIHFEAGQVPDTRPILTDDNKQSVFDVDISRPFELPYFKDRLAFWHEMKRICADLTFEGRPVDLAPMAPAGTDGPLTVACNLRGTDFLMDLIVEPDFAQRLLQFVTRAVLFRRMAIEQTFGPDAARCAWLADDCCQMIGLDDYRRSVLPWHQVLSNDGRGGGERMMHMCGKATHLFPTIRDALDVTAFDTGFPVDHGALREQLGDDILIQGGTEIALLLNGSPQQVHTRTRDILQSGVMAGGRFILREGNNLPPNCPPANLEAMYAACLEYGRYDT